MAGPQPPSPLGHPPQNPECGGLDGTQRGARQANSFPIAELVGVGGGEAAPTLITWWLKKKITRSGWQEGEARLGHGIPPPAAPCPPPVAPNKYLQGTPGLVALAGVGVRQPYFRQRSK